MRGAHEEIIQVTYVAAGLIYDWQKLVNSCLAMSNSQNSPYIARDDPVRGRIYWHIERRVWVDHDGKLLDASQSTGQAGAE